MILENKFVLPILLQILSYDRETDKESGGLLTEEITLGTKRRLQKIRSELLKQNGEIQKAVEEIEKIEDSELKSKELEELKDETFTINAEPVSLEMIENIKSKVNYDMILLEKITK